MELQDLLDHVNRGAVIEGGSAQHQFMHGAAQEALRTVAELNGGYRTPEEVRSLLSQLTGEVRGGVRHGLPTVLLRVRQEPRSRGGCLHQHGLPLQDAGGITIGDGTLIGHGSTLTTLNHDVDPDRRADMIRRR